MFVPFHDGVISQFEGYDELAELDWDAYRERYGNISASTASWKPRTTSQPIQGQSRQSPDAAVPAVIGRTA